MKTVISILISKVKTLLMSFALIMAIIGLSAFKNTGDNTAENKDTKKVAVIIVGHCSIPNDYPRIKEYFKLHDKGGKEFEKAEYEMVHWPRNENNDAYWAGFMKVVKEVERTNKYSSVHPAFNEMCAPTVDEALNEALKTNPDEILVTSIMLTPGGGHSERDIPASIEEFKKKHPNVKVVYAWPYEPADISNVLINQLNKFAGNN